MPESALPEPVKLEYKRTDHVIGHTPAAVAYDNRTGTQLSDDERKAADQVVGSPAQGNGVPNDNLASVGGLATDSGGTQSSPTVGGTAVDNAVGGDEQARRHRARTGDS